MEKGVVRNTDKLGRIVVPVEILKLVCTTKQPALAFFTEGDKVIMKEYHPGCMFCGTIRNLRYVHNTPVCMKCAGEISTK